MPHPSRSPLPPACLLLITLVALLALFPPETRGESMVGCALLVSGLALLSSRGADAGVAPYVLVVIAGILAVPLARVALAPGAAVEPAALALLGAGTGLAAAASDRGESVRRRVVAALALSAGAVSVHALYQKLWGFERLYRAVVAEATLPDRQALLERIEGRRAFAAFVTPAGLGGFLALALPVTLALALEARGRRRWAWSGLALLEAAAFLGAASATAAGALLGATALAAVAWAATRRRLVLAAAGVGLLLAGVAFERGASVLSLDDAASSWRLRGGNFRAAWAMAADHPWLGVGPGGFAELYASYRRAGDNETRHVHDLPLELAAELGWPGAVLVGSLFFVVFLGPLWVERRSATWRKGLAVGLGSFALHNLGDFTAFMPSLLCQAALMRGLLVREAGPVAPRAASRVLAAAGLVVVLVAAATAALGGLARETRMAARAAAHDGDTALASRLAARACRLAPWDPDAALLAARLTDASGGPTLGPALERADRAVALAPVRSAARALRAERRLVARDLDGALADMTEAVRLYPASASYARNLELLRREIERLASPDAGPS